MASSKEVEEIISCLSVPQYPLLEKANILLFYQTWYKGDELIESAYRIKKQCSDYLGGQQNGKRHRNILQHFRSDLITQLYRECGQSQSLSLRYLGLSTFVHMSQGLPRNLLNILKYIHNWSLFNGEVPFEQSISMRSQQRGISDSSEWFFRYAQMAGSEAPTVQQGIEHLAEFFRELRFTDKPSDCSLCTFSCNILACSEGAQKTIKDAVEHSLLIIVSGGQKDRTSMRVDMKYQLNSMLAPRWDLPISRGATPALLPKEVNAIFDPKYLSEFESVKRIRRERMTAPFFGKGRDWDLLPGLDK